MDDKMKQRNELKQFVDTLLVFFENASGIEEADMDKVNSGIKSLNAIKNILTDPTTFLTFNEKVKLAQNLERQFVKDNIEEYIDGCPEKDFKAVFGYDKDLSIKNIEEIVDKFQELQRDKEDEESELIFDAIYSLKGRSDIV